MVLTIWPGGGLGVGKGERVNPIPEAGLRKRSTKGRWILGSFWDHFAHSWTTLRSFWVYEVYFEVTLVHSQKTFIFPIDFNDFI